MTASIGCNFGSESFESSKHTKEKQKYCFDCASVGLNRCFIEFDNKRKAPASKQCTGRQSSLCKCEFSFKWCDRIGVLSLSIHDPSVLHFTSKIVFSK